MFGQRTSAPSVGGLTVQTGSLFGSNTSQSSSNPATSTTTGSAFGGGGGLFGGGTATSQPQSGGLFGGSGASTATSQPQQQQQQAGGGLFGAGAATSQPQSGGLFGGTGSTSQPQQQVQQSGGNLFSGLGGGSSQQQQQPSRNLFGSLGTGAGTSQPQQPQQQGGTGTPLFGQSGTGAQSGGLFSGLGGGQAPAQKQQTGSLFTGLGQSTSTGPTTGGIGAGTQQQPQQQQGPTLSLFGGQNAQQNQPGSKSNVVPGVKIDLSNLAPTTKFESCSDELKKEIEAIDTAILNQIKMCNEVSDLLPSIGTQGSSIPNDVEYVQGKLDTLQEALINDAAGIEQARNVVKQDATEARLAFRTLDTLLLPLQYQMTPGDRWMMANQQTQSLSKHSLRSALGARHNMLALPEDAEADANAATDGEPANLVEYFSQKADEMNLVVEQYRKNLKEVEDHLHGVEYSLHQQINELASAKSKDGASGYKPTSRVSELAGTLGDVETAILGVAGRLGSVKEEVQEMTLGPLGANGFGHVNGW